jgi:hypothetical protein
MQSISASQAAQEPVAVPAGLKLDLSKPLDARAPEKWQAVARNNKEWQAVAKNGKTGASAGKRQLRGDRRRKRTLGWSLRQTTNLALFSKAPSSPGHFAPRNWGAEQDSMMLINRPTAPTPLTGVFRL